MATNLVSGAKSELAEIHNKSSSCSFFLTTTTTPRLTSNYHGIPLFHQIDSELQDSNRQNEPAFYDTDGSPVYEAPYQALLGHIVGRNDVTALRLYQNSPHTNVFWEAYELPSWHPFFVAARNNSFDALRELLEIYLTDPVYTEPLDKYLERVGFSPINVACAASNQ